MFFADDIFFFTDDTYHKINLENFVWMTLFPGDNKSGLGLMPTKQVRDRFISVLENMQTRPCIPFH